MDQNFLDQRYSSDGTLYAPQHFKEVVQEAWFICDTLHIGYEEVMRMSVVERHYLIEFIKAKNDAINKKIEEQKQKAAESRNNRNR